MTNIGSLVATLGIDSRGLEKGIDSALADIKSFEAKLKSIENIKIKADTSEIAKGFADVGNIGSLFPALDAAQAKFKNLFNTELIDTAKLQQAVSHVPVLGTALSALGGPALLAVGAIAAVGAAGKYFFDLAVAAESSNARLQNSIGSEGAAIVTQFASSISDELGRSRKEIIDLAGDFTTKLNPALAGSKTQLAEYGSQLAATAVRLAEYRQISDDAASDAIEQAINGRVKALQKLVPSINDAAIKTEAARVGGEAFAKNLTDQQAGAIAAGLAIKEMAIQSASLTETPLDSFIETVVSGFKNLVDEVTSKVTPSFNFLIEQISTIGDSFGNAGGSSISFSNIVAGAINGVVLALTVVVKAVRAIIDSFNLAGVFISSVIGVISGNLGEIIDVTFNISDAFSKLFSGDFKGAFETAKNAIAEFKTDTVNNFNNAKDQISDAASRLFDGISGTASQDLAAESEKIKKSIAGIKGAVESGNNLIKSAKNLGIGSPSEKTKTDSVAEEVKDTDFKGVSLDLSDIELAGFQARFRDEIKNIGDNTSIEPDIKIEGVKESLLDAASKFAVRVKDGLLNATSSIGVALLDAASALGGFALGAIGGALTSGISGAGSTGRDDGRAQVVQGAFEGLTPVVDLVKDAFGFLSSTVGEVASALGPTFVNIFDAIKPVITSIAGVFLQLEQPLKLLGETIGGLFQSLSQPIRIIVNLLGQILSLAIQTVVDLLNAFKPALEGVFGAIGQILGPIFNLLGAVIAPLIPIFDQLGALIGTIANGVGQVLSTLLNALTPVLSAVSGLIGAILAPIIESINEAMTALYPILNIVVEVIGQVLGALAPLITLFTELVVPLLSMLSPIKLLAPLLNILLIPVKLLADVINFAIGSILDVVIFILDVLPGEGDFDKALKEYRQSLKETANIDPPVTPPPDTSSFDSAVDNNTDKINEEAKQREKLNSAIKNSVNDFKVERFRFNAAAASQIGQNATATSSQDNSTSYTRIESVTINTSETDASLRELGKKSQRSRVINSGSPVGRSGYFGAFEGV
jgi:phage-related protein